MLDAFKNIEVFKFPRVDHAEELHEDQGLEHDRQGAKLVGRLIQRPIGSGGVHNHVELVRVQRVTIHISIKAEDYISFQDKNDKNN